MKYKPLAITVLAILFGLVISVIDRLVTHQIVEAEFQPSTQYRCQIAPTRGSAAFRIYMPTSYSAIALANRLCADMANTTYASVEVSWVPREQIGTDDLLQRSFHMIWSRKEVMQGLLPDVARLYETLESMPHYSAHWFAHVPDVTLSEHFLSGKIIGLIDDQLSLSGYQAPKLHLKQSGVKLGADQIRLYADRGQLVADFLAREIDLIPMVKAAPQLNTWPENQTLLISDKLSVGSWYVSHEVRRALHCRLREALTLFNPLMLLVSQQPNVFKGCVQ